MYSCLVVLDECSDYKKRRKAPRLSRFVFLAAQPMVRLLLYMALLYFCFARHKSKETLQAKTGVGMSPSIHRPHALICCYVIVFTVSRNATRPLS